jgi:ribonucleoside-diphosphate reductase beta chain
MSVITEPRFFFKPTGGFEYPRYFDAFNKCVVSVWNPLEVDMGTDLIDWEKALLNEREIVGGILRGFTQIECVIGDYWSNVVSKLFPKPEIVMMCNAFAFFEGLHAFAYNHLSSTLNIDEYTAYYGDELAQTKIEYLLGGVGEFSSKVKLAVFSGGAEGVALFSSFSVLLSFAKVGKFKGVAQIISWSILDEQKHSDEGSELFKELVKLEPLTETELAQIEEGFRAIVSNEIAFLNNVFKSFESINGINKQCFIEFIKERANDRINNLGLGDLIKFEFDESLSYQVREWFYLLSSGNISNDFFSNAKEGSLYVSKPSFESNTIDWDAVKNVLSRELFA